MSRQKKLSFALRPRYLKAVTDPDDRAESRVHITAVSIRPDDTKPMRAGLIFGDHLVE
jgi:hypothetical protein